MDIERFGLDTAAAVAATLYEEFKEPLYAPPPMLSRMVEANLLAARRAGASTTTQAARRGSVAARTDIQPDK